MGISSVIVILVCIPPILAGASLEAGATFLMRRMPNHTAGDWSFEEEVAPRMAKENSLKS